MSNLVRKKPKNWPGACCVLKGEVVSTDMDNLPPLPKPPSYESRYDDAPLTDHYSANQMRAYGLACAMAEREKCAKLCDDASNALVGVLPGGAAACAGLADRIRKG